MDPCIRKRRDFRVSVGVEVYLWMRVLKESSREDGRGKRVPVSRSHRHKRIGECVYSVRIQFNREEVLDVENEELTNLLLSSYEPQIRTILISQLFWMI